MSTFKILIAAVHYPVASGRYIADAFRRLGHDVKTVGPFTGADIWGVKVDSRYVWIPNWVQFDDGRIVGNSDVDSVEWEPDLLVIADSAYMIDNVGCPAVVWGVDNHCRDYSQFKANALFLAHSWGARMSEPNAHWLPCAYDPHHFFDLEYGACALFVVSLGFPSLPLPPTPI